MPTKDECNDQQKEFAKQYMIDWNATRAAKDAGYSEKSAYAQGSKLLKNSKVRKYLNELISEHLEGEKEEIKAKCVEALRVIAYHDIREFINIETKTVIEHTQDGEPYEVKKQIATVKDTKEIDTRAVASIKQNERGVIEIKFHDKQKAIDTLMKYTGGLTEKVEANINHTYKIIPAPEPEEENDRYMQDINDNL